MTLSYLQSNNFTRSQTTALTLNQFAATTGNINLNNQKITNLSVATTNDNAINLGQADGRYYANTTKLNAITAPNASLDMSS